MTKVQHVYLMLECDQSAGGGGWMFLTKSASQAKQSRADEEMEMRRQS